MELDKSTLVMEKQSYKKILERLELFCFKSKRLKGISSNSAKSQ